MPAYYAFRQSPFANRQKLIASGGFTLIELLIVITIFVLVGSIITAAYLNFERSERLRNAALTLKSDIRFAQNNAVSGVKIGDEVPPAGCPDASTLVGWYVKVTAPGNTSYSISGVCLTGANEADFSTKTVNLSKGVSISNINYPFLGNLGATAILFRPISHDVSVHYAFNPPDFLDGIGQLWNEVSQNKTDMTITLSIQGSSQTYKVVVKPSGEVNEVKP